MSIKFHHHSFLSPSTSAPWIAQKSGKIQSLYQSGDVDYNLSNWAGSRHKLLGCTESGNQNSNYRHRCSRARKNYLFSHKPKRARNLFPFASSKDDVRVDGSYDDSTSIDVEAMRIRLDQALQNEDYNGGLVQSLYDSARVFELSIKERSSSSKVPWFSAAWLGVDKNGWAKALSYQASVYALLQAANEISSRRVGGDKDVNIIVQRSLLRLSAPLESIIKESLSGKQADILEWFWAEQIPTVVTTFVNHFERDPRFKAATMSGKNMPHGSGNASDSALIVLALVCITVVTKLGPAKVSCPQFNSMIPDVTGTLMDVLVNLVPIHEAYRAVKEIGLRREFLVHFGPRASSCSVRENDIAEETVFWVDFVQKQLQRAIDKEKIWSKLTTSESIEVLKRDLAIFGFFIALGRSTRSFLAANGFDNTDENIEGFMRYLIGGCVLYYPQFSSVNSYELYVEVVNEVLDWLPFYPGYSNNFVKHSHSQKSKSESPPNVEALAQALDVCSRWIRIFIKHSKWVENPSNVKAARFLSKGHDKLQECKEKSGLLKSVPVGSQSDKSLRKNDANSSVWYRVEPDSFDKALEDVEDALLKLEKLLLEMHVSSSSSGKEHLRAACSDLEKIRKLKKEAEFLEASCRAKAASLQKENDGGESLSFEQRKIMKEKDRGSVASGLENNGNLWNFLFRPQMKKPGSGSSTTSDVTTDRPFGSSGVSNAEARRSDSEKIQRFEILRNELMELEKRVQKSTVLSASEEDIEYATDVTGTELVAVGPVKNASFIRKSLEKLKETGTDVLQGTQLLAIDVGASTGFLRRSIIGDELTEKEKKFLQRTITDLASVVPIGILMLLPVTAVGHAAMLAAIQRYVPSLIPSTYRSERLDLLRQLEKIKQIDSSDSEVEKNVEN